jgi:plastocyanin
MSIRPLLIVILTGALSRHGAAASIEGTVMLPQTRSALVVNKRYEVVSQGGIVSTNPPLAVVYLEGAFPKPATPPVQQMMQKDLLFVPTLLVVRTGTKVEFPNLDDTFHNIFSYSAAKRFDLGRYRPDERPVPSQVFDVPGLVTLRCDIHEHMRGLILVVDTPHFVVTDDSGHYRLNDLPAGNYTVRVWKDSKTTQQQTVELKADSALHVDFP